LNLYIMRHAEAENETKSSGDEARPLTLRGRERTRDAAGGLRTLGLRFDAILTSPLRRAAETAELVADEYANDPPPQVLPALSPDVSPHQALAALPLRAMLRFSLLGMSRKSAGWRACC
jgi:phosphohistidine phosphatase